MRGLAAQRFNVAYFGPYLGWCYIGEPVATAHKHDIANCDAVLHTDQLPTTEAMNLVVGTKAYLVQQQGPPGDDLMSTEEALELATATLTASSCATGKRT